MLVYVYAHILLFIYLLVWYQSMFRVAGPFRNLQVKPVFWRNIILCILKGEMPFKMHKLYFFPEKKYVPTLPKIFRPVTQNTPIWPSQRVDTVNTVFMMDMVIVSRLIHDK